MLSSFAGNLDAVDRSDGVEQPGAIFLVTPCDRVPPFWDDAMRCLYPLHILGPKREKVVAPMVPMFAPAIRNRSERLQMRSDLAWVHRFLHQRRANVHWRHPISVTERRLAKVLRVWGKWCIC